MLLREFIMSVPFSEGSIFYTHRLVRRDHRLLVQFRFQVILSGRRRAQGYEFRFITNNGLFFNHLNATSSNANVDSYTRRFLFLFRNSFC